MDRRTHNIGAKLFFPNLKFSEIDRVNAAIDNPDRKMIAFQNAAGGLFNKNTMDFFGLTKQGGHRVYNHSMDSAIMAGFLANSNHAPELAMTHLLLDKMSNYMNDIMGSENKRVAESLLHAVYSMGKPARGEKVIKRKKMFY